MTPPRRFTVLLLALLTTLTGSWLTASPASAATVTVDYFVYELNDADATATLTDFTSPSVAGSGHRPDVIIPETVSSNGIDYTVTAIGDSAFVGYWVRSVSIPNSVKSIGAHAFEDNSLESLNIPASVTSIGAHAFAGNSLRTVIIPSSITSISDYAFSGNISLESVTIPDSVKSIGDHAFASSVRLTALTLGDSVETIGEFAFYFASLHTVTIPDSVISIGDHAFAYNDLTTLTLGDAVETIGDNAFSDNELTTVTIGDSVETIGVNAFDFNLTLSSVVFEGNAPATTWNGVPYPGAAPSLFSEASDALVVSYYYGAVGFDTSGWEGYDTRVLATVDFDLNGHGAVPDAQDVVVGETATRPTDPADPPHEFLGWFTDPAATTPFDFATPIDEHLTLYAGWEEHATVSFDLNGHGTAPAPATQDLVVGETATLPTDPTDATRIFRGWFTDAAATAPFDFTTPIEKDLTLYAGWRVPTPPAPPAPDEPETTRLAGEDRYDTAAEVSAETFDAGVDAVFVAVGTDFADALTGGPAAAMLDAPVLLVRGEHIPEPVSAELTRLAPERVFVVGGTGSVAESVADQLESYTTGAVTRLSGEYRYGTAAAVASLWESAEVVYLASGASYADALSGGAAAAAAGTPLLLTQADALPDATADALERLDPARVVVVGGTGAIGVQVEQAVTDVLPGTEVSRIAGTDRYATSALALDASDTLDSAVLMLATGQAFADALAGIPAAHHRGLGFALTRPSCLPTALTEVFAPGEIEQYVVLGGPGALEETVTAQTCTP